MASTSASTRAAPRRARRAGPDAGVAVTGLLDQGRLVGDARSSRSAADCSMRATRPRAALARADEAVDASPQLGEPRRLGRRRSRPAATAASSSRRRLGRSAGRVDVETIRGGGELATSARRAPSASPAVRPRSAGARRAPPRRSICSGVTASGVGRAGAGCSTDPQTGQGSPSSSASPSSPAMSSMRAWRSPASAASPVSHGREGRVACASRGGTRAEAAASWAPPPRACRLARCGLGRARLEERVRGAERPSVSPRRASRSSRQCARAPR